MVYLLYILFKVSRSGVSTFPYKWWGGGVLLDPKLMINDTSQRPQQSLKKKCLENARKIK